IRSTPPGVFGISTMLVLALLAGVSYAATVPAALQANWTIRMAWLGDERRYLTGVKHAAVLLVAALLTVLLPLHVALLGATVAVVHSLIGLLFGATALDALFLWYRNLPFACSYVPIENPKVAWPAAFAGLLITTYGFASLERWALQMPTHALAFGVGLGATALLVRALDRARRRERWPVNFDDRPAPVTQRLGLLEHIALHD